MTDDPRWARLMELFDGARDLAPVEQTAWLLGACPDDPGLRAQVERMLVADSRAEGILDRPLGLPPPEPLPVLAAELSARYELERELGEGGMARVFLAHERKHGRPVVLKVLKPEIARLFGHERFLREVRIVAQLAHPHIVGLIDSGEAGDLLYYVMPYLQGETLQERIRATGPLPIPLTITLLRDIAAALSHAHRAGVVHRDLKPGNILLVGDHAFLLDFGIAKLLQPVPGAGPPTESGGAIGTPAYMSPEQRVGDPTLDYRADIYTWGVVAYECLTGRLPDNQILGISAEDIADRRPETPPALARLVAATLSPSAEDRPKDGGQLLRALEGRLSAAAAAVTGRGLGSRWRMVATGLTVILTFAGAVFALKDRSAAQPGIRDPIAVGAFTNETGDPALDAWGRLAGDWITDGLHTMGPLAVIPWPTSLKASELIQDRRKAARPVDPVALLREETGAGTVITGSYYRVGDSLQFHAEVADAVAGQVLASLAPVEAPIGSPETAISELRRRVMGMVALSRDSRVSPAARLARRPPTFEAYQAFDRGLTLQRHQDYEQALPEFLRAFALDSEFVSSLLYAATASWNQGAFQLTDSLLKEVRIRRASLNDFWGMRLQALEARMAGDGQAELAVLRRAAARAPHSLLVYNLADAALNTDHPSEALEALKTLDTDRGDMRDWAPYWYNLAHAYHLLGQHSEELAAARQLRQRFPDRRAGLVFEVRALAAAGDTAGVDELLRAGQQLPPNTYWSQGAAFTVAGEELQAHGFGQSGWRYLTEAVSWLDRQLALTPGDRAHRYWLASALYDLGDWHRAYRVSLDLAREFPDRLSYRGLAAVAAARLGLREADSLIGSPRPYERGATALLKARIATIRADPQAALGLYSEATELGLEGLPWIHASAAYDLFLLGAARSRLPFSLRVGLNPAGAARGGP